MNQKNKWACALHGAASFLCISNTFHAYYCRSLCTQSSLPGLRKNVCLCVIHREVCWERLDEWFWCGTLISIGALLDLSCVEPDVVFPLQGRMCVRFELVLCNGASILWYLRMTFVFFQRYPTDKAYFIAKEILATERTYLKDLEVITVVRILHFL